MLFGRFTTTLGLCLLLLAQPAASASPGLTEALAARLANAPAEVLGFDSQEISMAAEDRELYAVYHEFAMQPLWVSDVGTGIHARALVDAISDARSHGLYPRDYHLDALQEAWDARQAEELARLDILLTLALLAWVNDISNGREQPRASHPDLFAEAGTGRADPVQVVRDFLAAGDPAKYLDALHPQHYYYRNLRNALPRYQALVASGGWPQVSTGATLHPGDSDPRVAALRRRLAVTGEYTGAEMISEVFDPELVEAVTRFQFYHGLAPDGVAGAQTVAALNVSAASRLRQIEINMERWRWMSHDLGNPHVMVDIAGFDVQAVLDDKPRLEMRAIVGKLHHETPVFSDRIRYIEFNPYWNLTPSIARHETIPRIRKDPNYLESKHIRVFDGWGWDAKELDPRSVDWNNVSNPGRFKFRQDPGPWNALGTMKFIFPNEHSVYLHDTPNHDLFARAARSFSHGCIRLSEPADLAAWILQFNDDDTRWSMEDIQAVLDSQERTVKNLSRPMDVHLTYETAWVDMEGALHFAADIYSRDQRLEQALYAGDGAP
ncbi:L,D-transpeptidase family protein [Pseudohalioglobus sediminis]|uniref:L,D-transpeptidase family protein n=1 Tax=Pseudohalioglobus sediminis TaxID=2606449 RepID=A0A5B0X680_9GAMM|nr:L,D-transpeptidase family protein [Pseudohalioglobus sediminis]KAA1194017.1 L,D-transpeptidase family protein [Pseudohalioglobus sediminis]